MTKGNKYQQNQEIRKIISNRTEFSLLPLEDSAFRFVLFIKLSQQIIWGLFNQVLIYMCKYLFWALRLPQFIWIKILDFNKLNWRVMTMFIFLHCGAIYSRFVAWTFTIRLYFQITQEPNIRQIKAFIDPILMGFEASPIDSIQLKILSKVSIFMGWAG